MKLNPPETAPKNMQFIGIMRGYPWPTLCVWNAHNSKWVWCNLQSDLAPEATRDTYFENEYAPEADLLGWYSLEGLIQ